MPTGSCLCRAVTFEIPGPLAPATACHCTQCRKQSGHYWASTDVKKSELKLTGEENVTWFQSSPKVRRGFCSKCGSALFWDPIFKDIIGVAAGAIDNPTGTKLALHIFTADKGDYYEIGDGVPQNER
jgi:hypothetical protein